jgi:AcrR family transcriptional regulator
MTGKREAIMRAARSVFGRVGYRGASIDVIAAEAEVSTRTIYNHFENKEELFATVLTESSHQVATAHESIIQHHLGEVTDLEADLIALSKAWVAPMPEFADHFTMVRRINAEVDNFTRELYNAWQEAGPLRVHRALAAQMARLADRGLLEIDDPEFAAHHFAVLLTATVNSRTQFGAAQLNQSEIDKIATTVVRAFLHGYLPRAVGQPSDDTALRHRETPT